MKKILLTLVFLSLAFVLLAYAASQFFLGPAIVAGVNRVGPRLTGTPVHLAGASLSLLTGAGELNGLAVGNPAGWSAGNALYLGRARIDLEPTSVLSDTIIIDELIIDQPEILFETRVFSSNMGDLLKNIEKSLGAGTDEPEDPDAAPLKYIVNHFSMQNGKVTVSVGSAAVPLPLPTIELRDLGAREGGLTAGELSLAAMRALLPQVIDAAANATLKARGATDSTAGETIDKIGKSLKKLLGGDAGE